MSANKPNRALRPDFVASASDLKLSTADPAKIPSRLSADGNEADAAVVRRLTGAFTEEIRQSHIDDEIMERAMARFNAAGFSNGSD